VHIFKKINRSIIINFENFFYLFSVKLKKVKNHIQLITIDFRLTKDRMENFGTNLKVPMSKISVSDKAQEYFLNIINKQKMEGLAIRLTASNVGTPGVQCGILY